MSTRLRFCLILLACLLTTLPLLAEGPDNTEKPAAEDGPQIILYQTSWCGYCRKTSRLLADLDADFVSKDIEKDRTAYSEYQAKGRGYNGIPLTDIGGEIVRGYQPDRIRQLVKQLQEQQAKAKEANAAEDESGR